MAYESPLLHRLRIISETTFGTDQTSAGTSFTSFLELPIIRGTFQGNRETAQYDPMTNEQFMDYGSFDELGPLRCNPAFDMLLHSHGVSIDGNTAGPDETTWGFAALLKHGCMGGLSVDATAPGATTQVQSGSSATVINVTAGHGVEFTKCRAIGVTINGKVEARPILSISTDAISVKTAFSGTPATSSTVLGSTTLHLTDTDNADSLQIAYEGKETSNRYGYMGVNGGFSFDFSELAKISFSLMGRNWLKYGTAALAAQTVTNFQPIVANKDSEMIVSAVGDTTRYLIDGTNEWTPNIVWNRLTSSAATDGVLRNRRIHQPPVIGGTLTKFRDGGAVYDFHAAYTNKTPLAFLRQLGSAAGGVVLLEAPNVQVWQPNDGEIDGALAEPIAWAGFDDNSITPANDLERSAFRMHFL